MKPHLILLGFLFSLSLWGHQTSDMALLAFDNDTISIKNNEIKINAFEILISPAIGITYERIINKHSSFGVYGFINFSKDDFPYRYEKFELAPFYRQYFGNKQKNYGNGFFTEIFTAVTSVDEADDYFLIDIYSSPNRIQSTNNISFAMGLSIGYKWVNSGDFVFEIFTGAGRYLISSISNSAYPRIGFMLGKRF